MLPTFIVTPCPLTRSGPGDSRRQLLAESGPSTAHLAVSLHHSLFPVGTTPSPPHPRDGPSNGGGCGRAGGGGWRRVAGGGWRRVAGGGWRRGRVAAGAGGGGWRVAASKRHRRRQPRRPEKDRGRTTPASRTRRLSPSLRQTAFRRTDLAHPPSIRHEVCPFRRAGGQGSGGGNGREVAAASKRCDPSNLIPPDLAGSGNGVVGADGATRVTGVRQSA
jgi:hypothetical protein